MWSGFSSFTRVFDHPSRCSSPKSFSGYKIHAGLALRAFFVKVDEEKDLSTFSATAESLRSREFRKASHRLNRNVMGFCLLKRV